MRTLAKANGVGYQQLDIHVLDYLTALFTIEFATLKQPSIMRGFADGQYSASHVATATEAAVNRIVVANATADLYSRSVNRYRHDFRRNQIAEYRVINIY